MINTFRPDGKAGSITVFEYLSLCSEREVKNPNYVLYVLSESFNIYGYYNYTEKGQKLLTELYIEAMYTPYKKNGRDRFAV